VILAMEADSGERIQSIRADGGASANDFLMQFQADVLGAQVVRPKNVESTALGAAYLAGLAVGFYADRQDIEASASAARDAVFSPAISAARRDALARGWERAVARALAWEAPEGE